MSIFRIPTLQNLYLILFASALALGADAAPIPAPPTIAGSGHLLIDHHSGVVLAENNADARLEPASLTKIMTGYVLFRELKEGNIKLDDPVLVSAKAWRTPGSRMFIEVGKKVSLQDLLMGMIVQSGNDASVALAEHIAGSEATFADLMNTHAARLGMVDSHFLNATGLPDENHYTTARDMAILTSATIREFPEQYAWYKIKEFTFNGINQHNRNKLLWRDESVDGVKTGHTEAAGYCLVASATRDDMRLVSVVMGTSSVEARASESQSLLNYGFRFFETHKLYAKDQVLTHVRLWKGMESELPIGPEDDVYVTIPRRQYKNLNPSMEINPTIMAPVSRGQAVGRVLVTLDDNTVAEVPLVVLKDIPEGGLWQRLKDSALLWFE
jgi:D-alanyl-D-alanine carboxypeptidase (penicillin-binding protein 5/6)